MRAWRAALVIAILDSVAWPLIAGAMLLSGSDPATRGLDKFAALAVTVLYVVTGAPALVVLSKTWAPRVALVLALAFPAVFAALFVAAIAMLP